MAKKKKAVKKAEASKPERKPPGQGMILMLGVFTIALIAVAAYFLYFQQGEPEISPSEFQALLQRTEKFAVVQDLRAVPDADVAARQNLQNCGIQAAFVLALSGKDVANYAYEGDLCWGGEEGSTPAQCEAQILGEGRHMVIISYGIGQGKTRFYQSRTTYTGDADFLLDCAISKIIR